MTVFAPIRALSWKRADATEGFHALPLLPSPRGGCGLPCRRGVGGKRCAPQLSLCDIRVLRGTQEAIDPTSQAGILAVEMVAACSFLFPRALGFNAPSALEEFPQFGQGPGVDDVSWLEPAASRLVDTEPHILKRVYRMRVR